MVLNYHAGASLKSNACKGNGRFGCPAFTSFSGRLFKLPVVVSNSYCVFMSELRLLRSTDELLHWCSRCCVAPMTGAQLNINLILADLMMEIESAALFKRGST